MLIPDPVVFLLDVDNTLFDNDRFVIDLGARLDTDFGSGAAERYWILYRQLRDKLGLADYLGALQIFRMNCGEELALLQMSSFMLDYDFHDRLYTDALKTIAHLNQLGSTVILSEGDIVFQPRKIQRSGLWDAVEGRVMICQHKERVLDIVQRRFPARHYVMIDNKMSFLAGVKRMLADRVTTVCLRPGHSTAQTSNAVDPSADRVIHTIADLLNYEHADFQLDTSTAFDLGTHQFLPHSPSLDSA